LGVRLGGLGSLGGQPRGAVPAPPAVGRDRRLPLGAVPPPEPVGRERGPRRAWRGGSAHPL